MDSRSKFLILNLTSQAKYTKNTKTIDEHRTERTPGDKILIMETSKKVIVILSFLEKILNLYFVLLSSILFVQRRTRTLWLASAPSARNAPISSRYSDL